MIPVDEMFRRLDEALAGVTLSSERVALSEAQDRILASDQVSRLDLPPFNKSSMDGYAVLEGDERDEYCVLGTVAAGHSRELQLVAGSAVKVMTGAPVPAGTGRVIVQESTQERDGILTVHRHDREANICWQGEDLRRGDLVLQGGTVLGALEIANLLACGITEVDVVRRVRLAIISTGDEIVASPDQLAAGKIIDTNGPLLAGLARDFGLAVVKRASVPDDKDVTAAEIRSALEDADVVICSGGISVGEFDFVHGALSDLGLRLRFAGVASKPGRPMTCATAGSKVVLALPGNPVAVYLMFHLCVLRVVALMSGRKPGLRELTLRLGSDFKRRKAERQEYVPSRLERDGAVLPVEFHGSAHLAALMHCDGFIVVPVGCSELRAGSTVTFVPVGRRV